MPPSADQPHHALLSHGAVSLVLEWPHGRPRVAHFGAALPDWQPDAARRPVPHSSVANDPMLALLCEEADGFAGRPGIAGARPDGSAWSPCLRLSQPPTIDAASAHFELADDVAALAATVDLRLGPGDTLTVTAELTNSGQTPYQLARLGMSVPVAAQLVEALTFTGRWCQEFQPQRTHLTGTLLVENRRGRTSHDRLPALFVGEPGFNEAHGEVLGAQLAWSGNYELTLSRRADGRTQLQAGELLQPGEMLLQPGERYRTPDLVLAWSAAGLGPVSRAFHGFVRARAAAPRRPRPVTLNTWEAVYFDHDLERLLALADAAAEVGVERFVLDDGWFGARRNDRAGLGDWWVSPQAWPRGLEPLVERVRGHGMEFGLWFEPEGVNPDSELFRAHPDWTLTSDAYSPMLARNQLVLDFGRSEVRDYVVDAIGALLARYPIAYIKWDMNRDLLQASGSTGRPGVHAHVRGVYAVLERLHAMQPGLEIESCASGGGRADLGILAHTQRIWTSDCNDAIDRQRIQRGFSMLFPPEVMGAHIGPTVAHTTGRSQTLALRAAGALFGHLGIEWNLLDASDRQRTQLARHVELYKRLRPLLHTGNVVRLDYPDPAAMAHGVVAEDGSAAVFALFQLDTCLTSVPCPLRLAGLDPQATYAVAVVDDLAPPNSAAQQTCAWLPSTRVSGAQLMASGLQPPIMPPQSVVVLSLTRCTA